MKGQPFEIPGALEPFHPQPRIDELFTKTYKLNLTRENIREGRYLFKISANDGYGNISLRNTQLDIRADSSLELVQVYNVPNPVKRNGTKFFFQVTGVEPERQLNETEIEDPVVTVRIFNQSGNLVQTLKNVSSGVQWDGRDAWGGLLANGVYHFEVTASQPDPFSGLSRNRKTRSPRKTLILSR